MKCEIFTNWLEDRDLHDVSEADKAIKHTEECVNCKDLYKKDEQLNTLLRESISPAPLPEKLLHQIDLNLEKQGGMGKRRRSWWTKGVPLALAAMLVVYLMVPFSTSLQALEVMGGDIVADHVKHSDDVMHINDLNELSEYCAKNMNIAVSKPNLPPKYSFIGARICPVGDHNSVHLTYSVEGKRVSLYIVKAVAGDYGIKKGKKYDVGVGNYNIKFWRENGQVYALLS